MTTTDNCVSCNLDADADNALGTYEAEAADAAGQLCEECAEAYGTTRAELIDEYTYSQQNGRDAVEAFESYDGARVTDSDGAGRFRDSYHGYHDGGAEYAAELAEDIGAVNSDYHWPASHIDWQAAWEALGADGYVIVNASDNDTRPGHVFSAV